MNSYAERKLFVPNLALCSWEENERSSWHDTIYTSSIYGWKL